MQREMRQNIPSGIFDETCKPHQEEREQALTGASESHLRGVKIVQNIKVFSTSQNKIVVASQSSVISSYPLQSSKGNCFLNCSCLYSIPYQIHTSFFLWLLMRTPIGKDEKFMRKTMDKLYWLTRELPLPLFHKSQISVYASIVDKNYKSIRIIS